MIFDLDGTICENPEFYSCVYSKSLEKIVKQRRGEIGLSRLKECRENYQGKGEIALFNLGIPFSEWAEYLIGVDVDMIIPQKDLCKKLRGLKSKKIIYTGSPIELAIRILKRMGFDPYQDFDLIIGWCEPELFPLKWTCSSLIFQNILNNFSIGYPEAWAVGDNWETDLLPAKNIGMKTVEISKRDGNPDFYFTYINQFLDYVSERSD